jgi:hypothetical protein
MAPIYDDSGDQGPILSTFTDVNLRTIKENYLMGEQIYFT